MHWFVHSFTIYCIITVLLFQLFTYWIVANELEVFHIKRK